MNRRAGTLLTTAIALLAAGAALHAHRPAPQMHIAAARPSARLPPAEAKRPAPTRQRGSAAPAPALAAARPSARAPEEGRPDPGRAASATSPPRARPEDAAGTRSGLAGDESVRRALQVHYEAERRLGQLAQQVPLTPAQRTQAFFIFAKSSPAYDPAVPIEADTIEPADAEGQTVEEQIFRTLDAEQQAAIEQRWVDRDLWWTEIVSQLAADFPSPDRFVFPEARTAAPPDAVVPSPQGTEEAAVEPGEHQGGKVFELLGGR